MTAEEKTASTRLRIRVQAYEHRVLDSSVRQIVDVLSRLNAVVAGPIPLPTLINKYTVNRSTFVHKDSRDQMEMRIHRRLVDILNPSAKITEALQGLDLPSSVSVAMKIS